MTEEWHPISGWSGYEVSDQGRVRSLSRTIGIGASHDGRSSYHRFRQGRMLVIQRHLNGYLSVKLPSQTALIHRLVCRAFHGEPPDPTFHADHINGKRSDNRAINLRWISPADNRARRLTAKGETSGNAKLTDRDILEIRALARDAIAVTAFDHALAARFAVTRESIRNIRRGTTWRHLL
jgi:hypothetical protein